LGVNSIFAPVAANLATLRVDLERRKREPAFVFPWIRAPQQRMHARDEFLLPGGLDHVVVGAILERKHDVLLGVANGHEQDRHRA
jgi:hypothetical protein